MRIHLTCSALALDDLPEDGAREVRDGATLGQVLGEIGLSADDACLVSLNDAVVPPSEIAKQPLNDGDQLVILPPLRGG